MLKFRKIHHYFKQIFKTLFAIFAGIFIFLLSCYLGLYLFYCYHSTKNSNARFNQITHITQAIYPSLALEQPILKYSYQGIDESYYIAVYRITSLEINAKPILKDQFYDCIKPTIKTKWMSPHLTFHYVQPPEYAKDHQDYEVHDTFIVHGSNRYVKEVAEICGTHQTYEADPEIESKFLEFRKREQKGFPEQIFFDLMHMRYNSKAHLLFIKMQDN